MASSRKTRSQLALPDINPDILARSPLKLARTAHKQNANATPTMNDKQAISEAAQDQDVPSKRPSSPLKDTMALRERDLKRARREGSGSDSENKNESPGPAAYTFQSPKKPSSSSSAPSIGAEYTPIRLQRASSVPPETATPIPHLDLNRVPPSPWRTPGLKLRITTVSSMESIQDTPKAAPDVGHDIVMATPTAGPSTLPLSIPEVAAEATSSQANSSSDAHPPSSSPLPSLPTSPVDEQPPALELDAVTPRKPALSTLAPTSPLTPLPATPRAPRTVDNVQNTGQKLLGTGANAPFAPPKTPIASTSRLPRPSSILQLNGATSSKPEIKPKGPSRARAMKPKQVSSSIPLGGRMTRSASLRQQETKKREDSGTAAAAPHAGKVLPRPSAAPSALGLGVPSGSNAPSTAVKTPGRRRSMSFSYAQPTTSSVAKSNPGSPTKPHSSIQSTAHMRSFTFSHAPQPPPSSSLSNLSLALEKLNVPPPSRPNTSMGFNRDARGEDTDDEDASSIPSTTKSKDDGDIAMRSTGSSTIPRPAPALKRSNTVGPSSLSTPSSSKLQATTHSKLMLPPPVPKARQALAGPSSSSSTTVEQPKKINLQSGIVAGKARGKFAFGGSKTQITGKPRIFGAGALSGPKSRVVHRASKQSSLPVVEGSPVKGGNFGSMNEESDAEGPVADPSKVASDEVKEVTNDMGMFLAGSSSGDAPPLPALNFGATATEGAQESSDAKESKAADSWKANAGRRASMASQLLTQSLSSMPKTPPRPVAPATEGKGKGRAGLRSSSSSYPATAGQGMHTAPGALGKAKATGSPDGAHVSKSKSGGVGSSSGSSSLKILKDCTIFVDVRTDDGDDAGSLFVDMLKALGAKIPTRVGQTCTHIVYKNGLMSTLTRYRLLHEPRPHVVGIAWVVECAEQRAKVDEKKFLVDLTLTNVAGTNKRRRSMLPKGLSEGDMIPKDLPPHLAGPSGGDQTQDADRSIDSTTSSLGSDDSPKGADDGLTPLERARRRNNTIKTMFARAAAT
ncbi:hypothetical protein EIP91_006757 [Steccherinum ochraceum]|uniref:BRCT domain-containing protein n=1 Tax=Steccherinum ochraceum TaxID=92696 RepID=A0A4R0R553_9APHY|nr:hypothetical protein EIP91_006757 [Steccherinum ochraceum]